MSGGALITLMLMAIIYKAKMMPKHTYSFLDINVFPTEPT